MDGIRGILGSLGGSIAQQMRHFMQALRESRAGQLDAGEAGDDAQTILRYKLDIDERGVLKSATPGQSQAAVTNQEQMNVRRLSAEAQRRGEDVVAVDVSYDTAVVDGKLVIVAGHTEVTSAGQRAAGPRPLGARAGQPPVDAAPPDPAGAVNAAEYQRIGAANREAAESFRLLEPDNEARLQAMSLGLSGRALEQRPTTPADSVAPDSAWPDSDTSRDQAEWI